MCGLVMGAAAAAAAAAAAVAVAVAVVAATASVQLNALQVSALVAAGGNPTGVAAQDRQRL